MKNLKGVLSITIAILLILGACSSSSSAEGNKDIEKPTQESARKMPVFSVYSLDGQKVELTSDMMGKTPIILDIWATWCPPCIKEIPHFVELQEKYNGKIRFIGLSVDQNGTKVVKDFINRNTLNYDIYMADQSIVRYFQVSGIPTTIILDKEHNIIDRIVGYRPKDFWENTIKSLLK